MKRFDITNKVNGMKFMVERETLEPMQPEWGQAERWSFDAPEDGVILDSREVVISPAMEGAEVVDAETGEVQPGFEIPAVTKTEFLLPAEYEITEVDVTEELEQKQINAESEAYLRKTDWYAIRFADSGEPMPEDVKLKRKAARERIKR